MLYDMDVKGLLDADSKVVTALITGRIWVVRGIVG